MSMKIKQDISLGNNLKTLRLNCGLTQDQVAIKLQNMGLSVSREMLSQMELGKYNIRVSILLGLKIIYDTNFEDFFTDLFLPSG